MVATNMAAVILSAGMSTRMGDFKPLLSLGKGTVIEQIVATIQGAGIRDIRVVLGYRAHDVIPVLKNKGVSWIINDDYRAEMFDSVKIGTDRLAPDSEGFFILPMDIPLIRLQTFYSLMETFSKDTRFIVYPTFLGERGHPPLIPRRYAQEIMRWKGDGGLKGFLKQYDPMSIDVPVFDEGILMDMDTPDQYRQIVARYENRKIPSKAECQAMMAIRFSEDHSVVKHGRIVARVARNIGEKLVLAGCKMDVNLVEACGYLHDIGKGEKEHAGFGAQLLKNMGYPNIADIVAFHMDLSFADEGKITEKEVVYLADKLACGEIILPLDKRLESKLKQLSDHPEGKKAAEKRLRTAMKIKRAIEKLVGRNIATAG